MTADLTQLPGQVLLPGSAEYEDARKPAMARFRDTRPAAIVRCSTAGEVAETLAFARRTGVHVVPRSGGHCFAGRSSTDGIVLDVSPMSSVVLREGVAEVGAGVRLEQLYDALDAEGLTIPAGCGPTVGIAGLTLGGGIGLLGRQYGLTADNLAEAELVLPDGSIVRCGPHENTDLYWAIRGSGGGQFGVLTKLWFIGLPSPVAHRFHLKWSREHAAAVIDAWQDWAPYAAKEVNANVRVTRVAVHLFGLVLENTDPARKSPDSQYDEPRFDAERDGLGGLDRTVAGVGVAPESAEVSRTPYRELKRSMVGLGAVEDDAGGSADRLEVSKSAFFGYRIPRPVWVELLAALGDDELNLTPMGGEYNRIDWTAFAHRNEAYLLELIASGPLGEDPAASEAALRSRLAAVFEPLNLYTSGAVYPNFPDPTLPDPLRSYHGDNLARLIELKKQYDPSRLFRFPQSL